jgi:hypothetical protein
MNTTRTLCQQGVLGVWLYFSILSLPRLGVPEDFCYPQVGDSVETDGSGRLAGIT